MCSIRCVSFLCIFLFLNNILTPILKSSSSIEALLDSKDIEKWRIPLSNLKFGQTIGRGAFGVVLHANLTRKSVAPSRSSALSYTDSGVGDTSASAELNYIDVNVAELVGDQKKENAVSVAVKKLPDSATTKNYYDLFKELNLMFHVGQHRHIVNLIGYCVENTSLYIVIDYAKHGNLKEFLRKHNAENSPRIIGSDRLLLYSYQIAVGMQYLHSKKVTAHAPICPVWTLI